MRVSILISAFLPPLRAETSASSARAPVSLHWASSSFLSFSRAMDSSCSQRSSSASLAASTMARAALSSDILASLLISSRALLSWLYSDSSFLLAAAMDWLTLLRSARFSLVSASSCSAPRLCLSAVSRRARLSSRALAMAADFLSAVTLLSAVADLAWDSASTLAWASLTWSWYFLMVDWVSALPAIACSRARPRSPASASSFFLHPESLSLALGLSLEGGLHGVKSLGLSLPDHSKLLILLSNAALNLLLDLGELHLASQHLVLLLLKGGLSLLKSGLELHLLSFKPLPDFVNLMDGAASLSDLVHDVLDLIGQGLVLTSDLLKLEDSLLIGRLDLEQLGRGIPGLLLAHIKVERQAVNLALVLRDGLVELLGLPLHGGVNNLGLVKVGGHLIDLLLDLALGLLDLGKLGIEVVNGSLGPGVPGGKLHLGHLELLSLGNSILLILLAHGGGITLGLGVQSEDILAARSLLIKSLLGNIDLVLEVPVLAHQQLSVPGLVVAQSLDIIELGTKRRLS